MIRLPSLFRRRGLAAPSIIRPGEFVGRARVHDVAFGFRMGGGIPGRVNRTHPATVEPAVNDATSPVLLYGLAAMTNGASNDVRSVASGDSSADAIYGIAVSPYPFQPATGGAYGQAGFGTTAPPAGQVIDILRSGYISVNVNVGATACVKGGRVFVWVAASSGAHVQGGFETTTGGGSNTIELSEATLFNGPPDANGVTELMFNI